MEQIELTLQTRNIKGSGAVSRMRRQGILPAIIYGEGAQPQNVLLAEKDFAHIVRHYEASSAIYHLQVMDEGKKQGEYMALLKDTQYDPVSDRVMHLDFMRISMDKEISIKVPIILKGTAIGLKKEGATLEHLIRELEIVCLPKNIPHNIEVDVSKVDTHVSIHVKDLALAQGVRTKMDPDAAVVTMVFATREVDAAAATDAAAAPELEVTKEKPKDPAAAAPAAGAKAAPAAGAKAAPAAKPEAKK